MPQGDSHTIITLHSTATIIFVELKVNSPVSSCRKHWCVFISIDWAILGRSWILDMGELTFSFVRIGSFSVFLMLPLLEWIYTLWFSVLLKQKCQQNASSGARCFWHHGESEGKQFPISTDMLVMTCVETWYSENQYGEAAKLTTSWVWEAAAGRDFWLSFNKPLSLKKCGRNNSTC